MLHHADLPTAWGALDLLPLTQFVVLRVLHLLEEGRGLEPARSAEGARQVASSQAKSWPSFPIQTQNFQIPRQRSGENSQNTARTT